MGEMIWVDQPPRAAQAGSRGQGVTQRFVAELRTNPGRWALYPRERRSGTSSLKTMFPDIEWTSRAGTTAETRAIYGRYVELDPADD